MSDEKNIGKKIFEDLVALENKLWNRADYNEEDITTFSNAMNFIEEYLDEFKEYFNEQSK